MQIKKVVYESVVKILKDEIWKNSCERSKNKYEINKLAERQKVLKQASTVLVDLIRTVEGKN